MILISHRGNLDGSNPDKENKPSYVLEAISAGFDVEVDVWFYDNKFWLGHDEPTYEVDLNFLKHPRMWVHAKNLDVVRHLKNEKDIHWFWHETDKMTLTSYGHVWCFPGHEIDLGIAVDNGQKIDVCSGICSDNILKWSQDADRKK